jgi:hypothetical protein
MGYHDNDIAAEIPPPAETNDSVASTVSRVLGIIGDMLGLVVRGFGIALLLGGLWISLEVVQEAWALYRQPDLIMTLADSMARTTGIDALVARSGADLSGAQLAGDGPPLRLSVLMAWFIAPVLLFTAGYLAMTAVRIGGGLALGPPTVRR